METTFYTVAPRRRTVSSTAPAYEEPMARELICLPGQVPTPAGSQGRVIDFTAWKQEHGQLAAPSPAPTPRPAPRPSRSARLLGYGEWLATLAVIGTMLLLAWRILVA